MLAICVWHTVYQRLCITADIFRTGSSSTVNECQVNFGFLPAKSQILIRTASFLQKFTALDNSLCTLLRMMLAGNCIKFLSKMELISKLHVSCVMLFMLNFWIICNPGCTVS